MKLLFNINRVIINVDTNYKIFIWDLSGDWPLSKTEMIVVHTINLINRPA